jgi:hypothetical protein
MLLAVVLDEELLHEEIIAVALVLSFQTTRINDPELDTPEPDCFSAGSVTPFGEDIFDISMAEIEAELERDGVRDDIWREAVALVGIHSQILAVKAS